jgi:PadR family transcriptional regulator PadR
VTESHDPQLLKGVLSLLLLALLAERESYGYELVQRVRRAGLPTLTEGTVYPALARMERERWIVARLVPSRSGPARKYYRPTADGYAALRGGATSWRSLTSTVSPILARPVPTEPAPPAEED